MLTETEHDKTRRIAHLNDYFRPVAALLGGLWSPCPQVRTAGIAALPLTDQLEIRYRVANFNEFAPEFLDPDGEHDYGSFDHKGNSIIWAIRYYAPDMKRPSKDPADPTKTVRVLVITHAEEY